MEAGVELDRAVAGAMGIGYREATRTRMNGWHTPEGEVVGRCSPPEYSTDLNAAFAAAERVGLFDGYRSLWQVSKGGDWEIEVTCSRECVVRASTPALVICMAILKEHKNGRESSV